MELLKQTERLQQYLTSLRDKFEQSEPPENKKDREFFILVKEETKPIYELLNKWEEHALHAVKNREVQVHPHQVSSTRENMELLLMHSYYIDARRKRYMELYKSILYVLDQIHHELSQS
ncbi:DUF1798 family protein [Oceanobacillus manasiensis]|uniref:DUF1798 family protein n=1 Tax=Oceanobacillus manasiensis TaxID=586413 RepID=UPI0005AA4A35|nr:DUF1798 family protein [Oceanobacillus manasiensis]